MPYGQTAIPKCPKSKKAIPIFQILTTIIQILREINFWVCRSAKSSCIAHLEAINFYFMELLALFESTNDQILQKSPKKLPKIASPKMITPKI